MASIITTTHSSSSSTSTKKGKVVDVHKAALNANGFKDLEHWLEHSNNVYIGRTMPYVAGAKGSIWANPFPVKKFGRDGCIAKFEEMIREKLAQDPQLRQQLESLRGCSLGCWCAPQACHGDVLIKILQETVPAPAAAAAVVVDSEKIEIPTATSSPPHKGPNKRLTSASIVLGRPTSSSSGGGGGPRKGSFGGRATKKAATED